MDTPRLVLLMVDSNFLQPPQCAERHEEIQFVCHFGLNRIIIWSVEQWSRRENFKMRQRRLDLSGDPGTTNKYMVIHAIRGILRDAGLVVESDDLPVQ